MYLSVYSFNFSHKSVMVIRSSFSAQYLTTWVMPFFFLLSFFYSFCFVLLVPLNGIKKYLA